MQKMFYGEYLSQEGLFVLWKLLNYEKETEESFKFKFGLDSLIPKGWSAAYLIFFISEILQRLNIADWADLEVDIDGFWKYHKKEDIHFKTIAAQKVLEEGKISFKNLIDEWGNGGLLAFLELEPFGEFARFSQKLNPSERRQTQDFLNFYLYQFQEDNLSGNQKNVFGFKKHQDIFINKLKEFVDQYGKSLFIKESDFSSSDNFFFLYYLFWLEHSGFIEIKDLEAFDWDKPISEQIENNEEGYRAFIKIKSNDFLEYIATYTKDKLNYNSIGYFLTYGNSVLDDMTDLENKFCKVIFRKSANYGFNTIEIENELYGESSYDNRNALKNVIKRLNQKIKNKFSLTENPFVYGNNRIKRTF